MMSGLLAHAARSIGQRRRHNKCGPEHLCMEHPTPCATGSCNRRSILGGVPHIDLILNNEHGWHMGCGLWSRSNRGKVRIRGGVRAHLAF